MRDLFRLNARRHYGMWIVAVGLLLGTCGCDSVEPDGDLVPVTGTVTLDGEPLQGATVSFNVAQGTSGQGGTGTTDAEGKYELSHFRAGTGVHAGAYTVTIHKLVLSDGSPIPPDAESIFSLDTKEVVPAKYNTATTLTATVHRGGEPINPIDFALKGR